MRLLSWLLPLGLITGAALSQQTRPIDALVASERSFAALSAAKGTRTAFLVFLDDSSIVFRPHPVNGKKAIATQGERPTTLSWIPEFADVAAGGGLGYTTGPWVLSKQGQPDSALAYGYFVSVWSKNSRGDWKVLLDGGTVNDKPPPSPGKNGKISLDAGGEEGTGTSLPGNLDIQAAELALTDSIALHGTIKGYESVAASGFRLYRNGFLPAVGKDATHLLLSRETGTPHFESLYSKVAASKDFGYVYGKYTFGDQRTGYFVRVWKSISGQPPRLTLDLFLPLAERK
jgi:ketosteroid isomerase-like protein